MSEMIEIVPSQCPQCGASWGQPGSVRPSWGAPLGQKHGRTWWCDTCGAEVYQGEIRAKRG